jgi:hypothetical protein
MKLSTFTYLLFIFLLTSCNKKNTTKKISNLDFVKSLDTIKIKDYKSFWILGDTLTKFIEPYTYLKYCKISELKAERDILNKHITYFRTVDTLTGTKYVNEKLPIILKNKFNIHSFDPNNGCLRTDSSKYENCYEYKMNRYINEFYGDKFIDSLKNSIDSIYHHQNKEKTYLIYGTDSYFLRKFRKSKIHQKWRYNLETNLIQTVIEKNNYDISEKNNNDLIIEFIIGLNNNIEKIQFLNNDIQKTLVKDNKNKAKILKQLENYLREQNWVTKECYGLKIKVQYYLHIRNNINYPYFSTPQN